MVGVKQGYNERMQQKQRLDVLMTMRGLAASRSLAQRLVMDGKVRVDGRVVDRPGVQVAETAQLELDGAARFVSRGGEKLYAALTAFGLRSLAGWVCADVGASTGGFTDCLLQAGVERVYALDVGQGILDGRLRRNERVVVMENINARYVQTLPEPVQLITVDASFISLRLLLPVLRGWLAEQGQVIGLIKPQFEAGRQEVGRGDGVIRDVAVHRRVLDEVLTCAVELGLKPLGLIRSPLLGPKGNTEFLAWLGLRGGADLDSEWKTWIADVTEKLICV